jgi:DNA-directed RNA polymerase subunit omega
MDPFVVFDCQQVVPDRFALALSAAARSRALLRGAQPRLAGSGKRATEVALLEIAGGAFSRAELAPFLRGRRKSISSRRRPEAQALRQRPCVGVLSHPFSPRGKREVMTQLTQQEKDHGETTVYQ